MIHVKKDYNDSRFTSDLKSLKAQRKIDRVLEEKSKHSFSGYRSRKVIDALKAIYNNKCAYCEKKQKDETFVVEHYRPKKPVLGESEHPGYYWLGYEWSNLLYACPKCNSAKRNKFPLMEGGRRVYAPADDRREWLADSRTFKNEKPLLLNPEVETDNPEYHLRYLHDGWIDEREGGSIRGLATIKICDLNRVSLYLGLRKSVIDKVCIEIKKQYNTVLKLFRLLEINLQTLKREQLDAAFGILLEEPFGKIRDGQKPGNEFSRVYHFFYREFDHFFDENITTGDVDSEHKNIIKTLFMRFKEGLL